MKKGLRPKASENSLKVAALKPCPDEEGIKTNQVVTYLSSLQALKPCPDEEGIKTSTLLR